MSKTYDIALSDQMEIEAEFAVSRVLGAYNLAKAG
jgi:hypothetical protein